MAVAIAVTAAIGCTAGEDGDNGASTGGSAAAGTGGGPGGSSGTGATSATGGSSAAGAPSVGGSSTAGAPGSGATGGNAATAGQGGSGGVGAAAGETAGGTGGSAGSWTPDGRFSGNPIIHSIYTADPTARVGPDGRLYLYPSHDIDPPLGCDLMDRYHVFSTSNLVDWVDEGEILNSSQVSWGRPEGGFMWAPDCIHKNGTYYYYFPHPSETDWGSSWKVGVATSSEPAQNFTVQGYIPGLDPLIDPAVFLDDDGQAYLYIGGGGVAQGGLLNDNMMEVDGAMQTMEGLVDFHEATWVHKRNGIYYLSYADNNADATGDNRMQYATSDSPLGPWTHRGVILEPTDSFCSHGSIVEFKGEWYLFYFTSVISNHDWLRSVAVDRLDYNDDGTIVPVVQTTEGVPSVGPPESPPVLGTYEAESGTLTTATVSDDAAASGGQVAGNLHLVDSEIELTGVDGGDGGRATIHLHYASAEAAKLRLTVNGVDHSFVNTPSTGGWSNFDGHSTLTVVLQAGTSNTIRVSGGTGGVNLDTVRVTGFPAY